MKKAFIFFGIFLCAINNKLFAMQAAKSMCLETLVGRFGLIESVVDEIRGSLPSFGMYQTCPDHIKTIVHYVVTGEVVDGENLDFIISDKKFENEYVMYLLTKMEAMCRVGCCVQAEKYVERNYQRLAIQALAKERAEESRTYFSSVVRLAQKRLEVRAKKAEECVGVRFEICGESFFSEIEAPGRAVEMAEVVFSEPVKRFLLLHDLADQARAKLPPEAARSVYLGNAKAIVHFVMTGEILPATKIDYKEFAQEYSRYLPVHFEAMRILGSPEEIDLDESVDRALATQDRATRGVAHNLNVLSLVSAQLAEHKK